MADLTAEIQAIRKELEAIRKTFLDIQSQHKAEEAEAEKRKQREREEAAAKAEAEKKRREQEEAEARKKSQAATTTTPAATKTTTTTTTAATKTTTTTPAKTFTSSSSGPKTTATTTTAANKEEAASKLEMIEKERELLRKAENDVLNGVRKPNLTVEPPKEQLNYGLDADLAKKRQEKYDPKLEEEAREWIREVTGEKLPNDTKLSDLLKSGVILCNLINKIKPGIVKKVNKMSAPFMQMENINGFLNGCKELGVPASDLFMTVDLYEDKNMNQVINTIHSLGRVSRRVNGYNGPSIGVKLSDKHEVNFTDEQLNKGKNILNYTQSIQSDTQKEASIANKIGYRNVVKTNDTGISTPDLGLLDKDKSSVQKEAFSARKMGHSIIKS